MPQHYITRPSDQQFLLPVDMTEWLPEDDLSTIVLDLVEHKFDLSQFYAKYPEDGLGALFDDMDEDDTRDRVTPEGGREGLRGRGGQARITATAMTPMTPMTPPFRKWRADPAELPIPVQL